MGTAGGQPGIAQLRGSTVVRGHCAFYAVRGRLHDMNTITAYCCSPMGTAVGATLPCDGLVTLSHNLAAGAVGHQIL
jgi:hypothetical protein